VTPFRVIPEPYVPADVHQARSIQDQLRRQVDRTGPGPPDVRTVVGLDAAYDAGSRLVVGAAVALAVPVFTVLASAYSVRETAFPYIPGLLAFRELPAVVEAWNRLTLDAEPDLVVCDGHGIAHPRSFGIACHFGVVANVPTVGVAKQPYVGSYLRPQPQRGAWTCLEYKGSVIGRALRTQTGVKEVFVSVGHRVDLETATKHVLTLSPRFRLPETTRAADSLSRQVLRSLTNAR
jgi:deoxyribonuclease V